VATRNSSEIVMHPLCKTTRDTAERQSDSDSDCASASSSAVTAMP
jgi:hypothetical protein